VSDTLQVADATIHGMVAHRRPEWTMDAMACLPLWLQDATPAERDERERQHRAFVASYR
jgi:hypothetical protein